MICVRSRSFRFGFFFFCFVRISRLSSRRIGRRRSDEKSPSEPRHCTPWQHTFLMHFTGGSCNTNIRRPLLTVPRRYSQGPGKVAMTTSLRFRIRLHDADRCRFSRMVFVFDENEQRTCRERLVRKKPVHVACHGMIVDRNVSTIT